LRTLTFFAVNVFCYFRKLLTAKVAKKIRKGREGIFAAISKIMLRSLKRSSLKLLKGCGVLAYVKNSRWRQSRLLILCYHGISQKDEHEWRPNLYMPVAQLAQRLQMLKSSGCAILPLGEAIRRLYGNDLPPRSVVLTFDDGCCDFYRQAYPLIKSYGFPVTVYQSTYYVDDQKPVFNLICSYMLWKCRGKVLQPDKELGITQTQDLAAEAGRRSIVRQLMSSSAERNLTGTEKNDLAERLAALLGMDFSALVSSRLLQLMNASEIAELSQEGVDFQLHTHRHRVPDDQASFQKEIRDNRKRLLEITGHSPVHFCYPQGHYKPQFLPWLAEEGVISATTCDSDLASTESDSLLLPRFVDTTFATSIEFDSWLSGIASVMPRLPHSGEIR